MIEMRSRTKIAAWLAAAALVALPAGLSASTATPRLGEHAAGARATETSRAIVIQIDPAARKVRVRALDGVARWLVLTSKAGITLNGKPAQLAEIRKGFVAEATLNSRGRVTGLKVTGRLPVTSAAGVLQSIDATQLTVRKGDATAPSLPVDPAAVVVIDGQPATLADLAPRMKVVVRYRGSDPVFRIEAQRILVTDRGVVEALTPKDMSLRLPSGLLVPIPFAPDTVVRIGLRLGTTADVKLGGVAEVQHLTGGPALLIRLPRGS